MATEHTLYHQSIVSITQILERYDLLNDLRQVNDDQLTGSCAIELFIRAVEVSGYVDTLPQ